MSMIDDPDKVNHVLLSCGWIPIDAGSLKLSTLGSPQHQWGSNPGFVCMSEGKKIRGPLTSVLAVKEDKK